jgi:hypothetical protein
MNFKTSEEMKKELKQLIKENGFKPEELEETKNSFSFKNYVWLKPSEENKKSYIENLPFDVKGKNIKEYGNNWIKTEYAKYSIEVL